MAATLDLEEAEGGVEVVIVRGEHDLATAGELRSRIESAIGRATGVVVDLTQASFIDSAVLQVLLSGSDQAGESEIRYVLALGSNTGYAVKRLLELTGLDQRLVVAEGREAAIMAATPNHS